jgi:cysteine desulfurase family protein (TIGR01976 family)
MSYDVAQLRTHFPSLQSGIAHFDGPGGTQTPREVGEAVAATLSGPLSNRGTGVLSERNADDAVRAFRAAFSDFLGVPANGVVYGRSATQITMDLSRALAKTWGPGDQVAVSRLDHDCNVRPWIIAAENRGASVRWIDFDPETAEVEPSTVEAAIGPRTKIVAITGASNILGTKPALRAIADQAHAAGALLWVDGVHYAAHEFVDLAALGADFFVCSPYKFLGPHCAVLGATPERLETIRPDKLAPATDVVPERFELGTLPYELMAGATAAVGFLAAIAPGDAADRRGRLRNSVAAIDAHELRMRQRIEEGLAGFGSKVRMHSLAGDRTPTLYITLPGRRTADAAAFLVARNVQAPASHFYGWEPWLRLGLDDDGLRMGVAPYTNDEDVDRLLDGLAEFLGE